MKKRLFVAVPMDDRFYSLLDKYAKVQQAEKFLKEYKIRWTPAGNLHLTLCFLGYFEDRLTFSIIEQLSQISAELVSFTLEFGGITWGPPVRSARMLWGVFRKSEQFAKLAKTIAKTLSKKKINLVEERGVIPHVTLARFQPLPKEERIILPQIIQPRAPMSVRSFHLYESHLQRSGAVYNKLATFFFKDI